MGSTVYRPGHAKAHAITAHADYTEGIGWSLVVVRASESGHGVVTQRMAYRGLDDSTLIDVVDVELSQALGII